MLDEVVIWESFIHGGECLLDVEMIAVEKLVSISQSPDTRFLKAATSQANLIDPSDLGWIAVGNHERRNVLHDLAAAPSQRMLSNPAELMHRREPTDHHMVLNGNMTR